jgi:hypothetical protein
MEVEPITGHTREQRGILVIFPGCSGPFFEALWEKFQHFIHATSHTARRKFLFKRDLDASPPISERFNKN